MNKPKVKEISPTLFEVLNNSVKLQKRKGRTLLLCSCTNSSYFANNNFCWHKELVFEYLNTREIKDRINKLIEFYEGQKEINMQIKPEIIINDLKNLK